LGGRVNITFALASATVVIWGFLMGVAYMTINNLTNELDKYKRREALINEIVDKRLKGQEDE